MHIKPRATLHALSRSVVIAIIATLTLAVSATALTITVTSTADSGGVCPGVNCTLRQAIATAVSGDTIDFSLPASSAITLTSGELLIERKLTINGPGPNLLQVRRDLSSGTPDFRIFHIAPTVTLNISGLAITNGAADKGGGIFLENSNSTVTLVNCAVSGNRAVMGAGIYAFGGLVTVMNSTIDNNHASGSNVADNVGGGILAVNSQGVIITNSTISSNTADGSGGGICNVGLSGAGSSVVTITNSTIAKNQATHGQGGGVSNNGTVSARNTIIAQNTTPSNGTGLDVSGALSSQGYNLIGNTGGASITGTTTGNQYNVDPSLGPLQNNGGPTFTHALLSNSPALDAGHSGGSNLDQRGLTRPVDIPPIPNASGGDGSDIGAYEAQPYRASTTFVVTNTSDSGAGSLRQAIADANDQGQFDAITFNIPTSDPGYDVSSQMYAIDLTSGELAIISSVSIDGGNARIAVGRGGATPFRLFNVSANGVTLANLFLRNGVSVGGPSAPGLGGGVFNSGGLTLLNCTFSGNTATGGVGGPQLYQGLPGGEGLGGAVCNDGTLVMTNCTFSGNSVQGGAGGFGFSGNGVSGRGGNGGNGRGGGLFSNQGPVTLTNCTFTKNTALGSAPGGGDIAGAPGSGIGGGAVFASGNTTVNNSILSGNTAAISPDYSGTVDGKANLIGGTPNLDSALKYNGGSTPTIALLAGSPAINGGDGATAPDADQRGYPRVGVSDIGAFEFGSSAPIPTPSPTPTATPAPTATPTVPPVTTLANISTRLRVETGDNVLIGGFIVTGTQPKKVIVRAIGTSLPFADKLANPTLELHGPNGLIEANDNWVDSPNKQAIIDSTIPPSSDLESAIVATLPANNAAYTAIVRGANGGTGIGVVEAYDLDTAANSRLANISTRGLVQTGDNVLIAGTIVVGPSSQKVLIRGIGPSLSVAGKMDDPILELRDSNGAVLQSNDNWVDSPNKQAIIDSTIPPTNDLESAIIATLPGNNASYTAVLRGVNNTTGIAVVEVYALP